MPRSRSPSPEPRGRGTRNAQVNWNYKGILRQYFPLTRKYVVKKVPILRKLYNAQRRYRGIPTNVEQKWYRNEQRRKAETAERARAWSEEGVKIGNRARAAQARHQAKQNEINRRRQEKYNRNRYFSGAFSDYHRANANAARARANANAARARANANAARARANANAARARAANAARRARENINSAPKTVNTLKRFAELWNFKIGNGNLTYRNLRFKLHPNKFVNAQKKNRAEKLFKLLGHLKQEGNIK